MVRVEGAQAGPVPRDKSPGCCPHGPGSQLEGALKDALGRSGLLSLSREVPADCVCCRLGSTASIFSLETARKGEKEPKWKSNSTPNKPHWSGLVFTI